MAQSPKILFMNQNAGVREWFFKAPSLKRAEELGYEVAWNEKDEPLSPSEWGDMLEGVEILLTTWGSPRLEGEILAKADALKMVGHVGGSVAPIISDELYERGVRVTTANVLMARSVAEQGIMLMMMGLRQAHVHAKLGTRNDAMVWGKDENIKVPQDCVIGIWGYGDVAKWVVSMLRPMEPKTIAVCSNHMSAEACEAEGMVKMEFGELFAMSDVIFCLAGMTVANTGAVGKAQLESMKDGAVLINLGRAPLIQPDALIEELKRGRWTAILDVFEKEPLPEDDPLNSLPNVILTPHNAGTGRDGHYLGAMLDEAVRLFAGEPLKYEVEQRRGKGMTDLAKVREEQKKQQ